MTFLLLPGFIIRRATPCLRYIWHCRDCFMAKRTVLQSQFVQPKHLYPIMKLLKMLGCCQMACRWGEAEQASLAALEACTPVMPLKVVVMLFWKQYTREIWNDAWMEHFGYACPRSIFFIYLYGSKKGICDGTWDWYYRAWLCPHIHPFTPTHTHTLQLYFPHLTVLDHRTINFRDQTQEHQIH